MNDVAPHAPSPLVAQYRALKAAHPDCLLFFRLGDFYELFFDDAAVAAAALGITLTRRGKHGGDDIPMCGVPAHAADQYLARLIRGGHRVAVAEQVGLPGRGGLMERRIVRIVTPGTITEDSLLESKTNAFLAALAEVGGEYALAWLDLSTGEFFTESVAPALLPAALARIAPQEVLASDTLPADTRALIAGPALTLQPASRFDVAASRRRLESFYRVATLDGLAPFARPEIAAAGALLAYVELTQTGQRPALAPLRRLEAADTLVIDAATRRNLELDRTLAGARDGSLLATIDRTVTSAGARALAQRLAAPLTDLAAIEARLDGVTALVGDGRLRETVRRQLRGVPDLARAVSRLALNRGGPREMAAIGDAIQGANGLAELAGAPGLAARPPCLRDAFACLDSQQPLGAELARALGPDLPAASRDGGFIAAGFDAGLDEQRRLRDESRRLVASLEQRYRQATGVATLRIRHNNVLGYTVETTPVHADKVAAIEGFVHRQTLVSAVRFTTAELRELESAIAQAADRALAIELALFDTLSQAIAQAAGPLQAIAAALAELDCLAGLAELAATQNYCRPSFSDQPMLRIQGGRHPVVEQALGRRGERFVANDCRLDSQPVWLLTGPNMAGKSTFLRQNALIALLAQMGSFVPAGQAEIGVVDRLFSRVGAADDLASGRSTFMVEMVETAAILNQATTHSLVILDEIGRGTATFDGLSIAWAVLEHIDAGIGCRTLFATHYHELTGLADRRPGIAVATMRVKEWQGDVVFLHEVAPGRGNRSYGVHVARLAGLPAAVVGRAAEILELLEKGSGPGQRLEALPLFAPPPAPDRLRLILGDCDPDSLTPREAIDLLYRLKAASRDGPA